MKIPIFTSQLEKSREATDAANLRAAYAEVMACALTGDTDGTTGVVKGGAEGTLTFSKDVVLKQATDGWKYADIKTNGIGGVAVTDDIAKAGKTITVKYDQATGAVSFAVKTP